MYLDKTVDHQYEMAKVLAIKKELENEIAKNKTIIDSLDDTIIKHIHAINLPLSSKMLRAAFHQQVFQADHLRQKRYHIYILNNTIHKSLK